MHKHDNCENPRNLQNRGLCRQKPVINRKNPVQNQLEPVKELKTSQTTGFATLFRFFFLL